MNQHIREKTDEHVTDRTDQMKTRHTELEAKQHEDQLRYLEVEEKLFHFCRFFFVIIESG